MSVRKQCYGCDVWFNGEANPDKKYCERCQGELDAIRPALKLIRGGKDDDAGTITVGPFEAAKGRG